MSLIAQAILQELRSDPQALRDLAEVLAPYLPAPKSRPDGWLRPAAAAEYLGVSRKRIHDLTSSRALAPDGRDGRTPLFKRETLDAYARGVTRLSERQHARKHVVPTVVPPLANRAAAT